MERFGRHQGISLLDALLACTVLAVGVLSLAHLFAVGVALNGSARDASLAALLAAQKLEELRSHPSVEASPSAALEQDTPGFVDYVDRRGNVGTSGVAVDGAVYVRRWSAERVPDHPDTLVIQVRVTPVAGGDSGGPVGPRSREARLLAAKTRRGP